MTVKQLSILEIKRSERIYQLILYSESPVGEIFDVLTEMRNEVLQVMNDAQKLDSPHKDKITVED